MKNGVMNMIPLDVHAHGRQKCGAAIVSGSPAEIIGMMDGGCAGKFSAGVHPWNTADRAAVGHELEQLESVARLQQVVAIGETGLDALRGAPQNDQERIFMRHVFLSETVGKPLVLHVVRTGHRIMELCKDLNRTYAGGLRQPWIWHGFRGSPQQASQFMALRPENYLSFGVRFNPSALSAVPLSRILAETDDASENIDDVIERLACAASTGRASLSAEIESNLRHIFPTIA